MAVAVEVVVAEVEAVAKAAVMMEAEGAEDVAPAVVVVVAVAVVAALQACLWQGVISASGSAAAPWPGDPRFGAALALFALGRARRPEREHHRFTGGVAVQPGGDAVAPAPAAGPGLTAPGGSAGGGLRGDCRE